MKRQLLHTPEGVRDIYNDECEKKLILQDELLKVQKQYGYHPIQTPTFEFFDTFGREIGTTPSKDLYKFFDREGNTLVLRPDITPSIARCAAMYFGEEKMPIRLCYMGNTFLNNSSYQGRLKESTQLGAAFRRFHGRCRRGDHCHGDRLPEKSRIKRVSAFRRSCRIFPRFDRCGRVKGRTGRRTS